MSWKDRRSRQMPGRRLWLLLAVIVVACGRCVEKSPFDIEEAIAGVRRVEDTLRDVAVRYETEHTDYAGASMERDGAARKPSRKESVTWGWKAGKEFVERTDIDTWHTQRMAFDGERSYEWTTRGKTGAVRQGAIETFAEVGAVTPGHFFGAYPSAGASRSLSRRLQDARRAGRLAFEPAPVRVGGDQCFTVRIREDIAGLVVETCVSLCPRYGWVPKRIDYVFPEVDCRGPTYETVEFKEVHTAEGIVHLPWRGRRTSYTPVRRPDGAFNKSEVVEMTVEEIRVNEGLQDEEFGPKWPAGFTVTNHVTSESYIVDRRGKPIAGTVKDLSSRDTAQAESTRLLIGSPLPSVARFGVELDTDTAGRASILVCFWDMKSRASRHTLRNLAEKADYLAEKGVAVVCVHAGSAARDALDEWLDNSAIPFPVGTIGEDRIEVVTQWSVDSLPWFILTDSEQIVRSTGFGLADLDAELAAIERE